MEGNNLLPPKEKKQSSCLKLIKLNSIFIKKNTYKLRVNFNLG